MEYGMKEGAGEERGKEQRALSPSTRETGKAAPASDRDWTHGERSSATTRLEVRFNHVPIVSPERLLHAVKVFTNFLHYYVTSLQ
jgi:hypothetical protein